MKDKKEDKVEIKMKFINLTIFACVQLRSTKKKKNGACVFLGAGFSKSFEGNISHIWTEVSYRLNKKKKKIGACVVKGTRIFSKFFGGKIKHF